MRLLAGWRGDVSDPASDKRRLGADTAVNIKRMMTDKFQNTMPYTP